MKNASASAGSSSARNLRAQLAKSVLVMIVLAVLVVNQYNFLHHAILAHPALNILIITVFFFGALVTFRGTIGLFNDIKALAGLKQIYADFEEMHRTDDPFGATRLERSSRPGIVFRTPRILAEVYDMCVEEMLKTRRLNVSLAQRGSLLGMTQDAINRERSLSNYLTGVLILLGLIGTFIGLMEMVASVGQIVGGLAKTGSGSDAAIQGVIKDLEAPLVGMATGFSASLFGLLGSLFLGLLGRFGNNAAISIKHDFEHWLSAINKMEQVGNTAATASGDNGSVAALAASLIGSFRTTQGLINRSAEVMRKLADRQDKQTDALNRVCEQIEALSTRQNKALAHLRRLDVIGDAVDNIRQDAILRDKAGTNRLAEGVGRIVEKIESGKSEIADTLLDISQRQRATERMANGLEVRLSGGLDEINQEIAKVVAHQDESDRIASEGRDALEKLVRSSSKPLDTRVIADQLAASVDERLAAGFGAVAGAFDSSLEKLAASVSALGMAQAEIVHTLATLNSNNLANTSLQDFARTIENGLSSGLSEIASAMDGLVKHYATMVETRAGTPPEALDAEAAEAVQSLSAEQMDAVYSALMTRMRKEGTPPKSSKVS